MVSRKQKRLNGRLCYKNEPRRGRLHKSRELECFTRQFRKVLLPYIIPPGKIKRAPCEARLSLSLASLELPKSRSRSGNVGEKSRYRRLSCGLEVDHLLPCACRFSASGRDRRGRGRMSEARAVWSREFACRARLDPQASVIPVRWDAHEAERTESRREEVPAAHLALSVHFSRRFEVEVERGDPYDFRYRNSEDALAKLKFEDDDVRQTLMNDDCSMFHIPSL